MAKWKKTKQTGPERLAVVQLDGVTDKHCCTCTGVERDMHPTPPRYHYCTHFRDYRGAQVSLVSANRESGPLRAKECLRAEQLASMYLALEKDAAEYLEVLATEAEESGTSMAFPDGTVASGAVKKAQALHNLRMSVKALAVRKSE